MDWTEEQNKITVENYLEMLRQELADQSYVKARFEESVAAQIGRSKGAVSRKMSNISAVMNWMRIPWIDGYKPLENIQRSLAIEVSRQVGGDAALSTLMTEAVTRTAVPRTDINWTEVGPPSVPEPVQLEAEFVPAVTDYARLEAENRALGRAGELAVLERERTRLNDAGRADLAGQVLHVTAELGDGAGYDILSFDKAGKKRYLEVKATRRGSHWPMIITRNEVRFSETHGALFELHRVFHFDRPTVGIYVLTGAVAETCWLDPLTFRAAPKAA